MGKPELRDELDAEAASVVGAPYSADPGGVRTAIKASLWTIIANAVIDYMGDLAGEWDDLNITGTPNKLAGFDGSGNPVYYSLGGGGGVTDHFDLNAPSLVWEDSAHTGDVDSLAGFDGSGDAVYYVIGVDLPSNGDVAAAEAAANTYTDGQIAALAGAFTVTLGSYQVTSAKGAANGYADLDASVHVPTAQLGSGSATANTVLHGDQSWGAVALGSQVSGDLPFANLTQGSGLSVLGVTGGSTADFASIAGTADQVLRVNGAGTSLAFGAIDLSKAAAVTGRLAYSNLAQGSARSVLGVVGNATADVASIQGTTPYHGLRVNSAGTGLEFALVDLANQVTGDLPFSSLAQGSGLSVLGVTGGSTADFASIAGTADQVLRVNGAGTSLVFGAIDLSKAAAVTGDLALSNLAQGTARSLLGVAGNATADYAPIQGTTAYHTLRVNSAGTGLEFGLVDLANQVTGDLPFANLVQSAAGLSVLGKAATGTGDFAEITVAADTVVGRDGSGDVDDIKVKNAHIDTAAAIALTKLATIAADTFLGSVAGGTPAAIAITAVARTLVAQASQLAMLETGLGFDFDTCGDQTLANTTLANTSCVVNLATGKTYMLFGTIGVTSPAADDAKFAITSTGTITGFAIFSFGSTAAGVPYDGTSSGLIPTSGAAELRTFMGIAVCAAAGALTLQAAKFADTGADGSIQGARTWMLAFPLN